MLSRVADAFYWMSRYLERAEHSARAVDVYLSVTLDGSNDEAGQTLLNSIALASVDPADPAAVTDGSLDGLLTTRHRDAIAFCIATSRDNARNVREQISSDMWEQLNRLYLVVGQADGERLWLDEPGVYVRTVIAGAQMFHGVTDATLSHGEGWHYIQIGRFIERAATTAAMLEGQFTRPAARLSQRGVETHDPLMSEGEYERWVSLLRASAAFEAYCRYYTAELRPDRIAEFLLLNAEFPRSIRFVADRIESSLRAIAALLGRPANGRPERFAGRLKASLNYGQIDEIMADEPRQYLESIRRQCEQVHAALYETYITYPIESALAT
jgi:uncharacterized alpha-E superfamily protein